MRGNIIQKIIGYILLIPAILSVYAFVSDIFLSYPYETIYTNLDPVWVGFLNRSSTPYGGGGGGFTSALPFYLGLMAMVGAYLIKDEKLSNKRNTNS